MNKLATILLCVNFITVLFPQPGYIHPDEFFQSSEIVAGDMLGVEHFRAWEFEPSTPVRSIVFPYLVAGPSISLLRWMNSTGIHGLQISAVKVVMATRLPLAFLSVFGYLATSRLALVFGAEEYLSTVLWCSSYVTWAYFTRTFSNTVEAVLLAVVLLLVLSSPAVKSSLPLPVNTEPQPAKDDSGKGESPKTDQDEKSADSRKDVKKDGKEKKRKERENERQAKLLPQSGRSSDAKRCSAGASKLRAYLLGAFITAGFFNRPTFPVFVAVPVLLWLYSLKANSFRERSIFRLLGPCFFMSVGALVVFCGFVVADTLYFNPDSVNIVSHSLHGLFDGSISFTAMSSSVKDMTSAMIVTPWNFIQYNLRTENLAQHGLHPRYTHIVGNLPLLTGPLYVPIVITSVLSILRCLTRQSDKNNGFYDSLWLTSMMMLPVLALSVFPHQEPRFLIPLLPVLVVLGAKTVSAMAPAKLSFFALWAFFNIFLVLVYGYIHQAALVPALSIYQQKLSSSPVTTSQHHAIFYKTYPPPRHLLLVKPQNMNIKIHDLAGAPIDSMVSLVKSTKSECVRSKTKCQIYVFLPSTVTPRVLDDLSPYKISTTSICPHLSMESPPRFRAWWSKRLSPDEFLMDFCLNIMRIS
ncbi:GPI mannosyltransferase 4 [Aplysia californica]|uniref:Mannosyltransferase n=1 Tax=Aplysia californica TaxID=6500 RepID=A0ABM0JG11_APLCA|nr:GPI mannosyltransferase 4 [Aplysia californica]